MIKFKPLIIAAALSVCTCLPASAKTTQLTIKFKDGRSAVLDLTASDNGDEKLLPVMTFTPTALKVKLQPKETGEPGVTAPPSVYTFEVEDLQDMVPIETNSTSAIADIIASGNAIVIAPLGGDLVNVTVSESLKSSDVRVFDLNGRQSGADVTDESVGSITLSLASLQPGIYIVNISSHSLKITKR